MDVDDGPAAARFQIFHLTSHDGRTDISARVRNLPIRFAAGYSDDIGLAAEKTLHNHPPASAGRPLGDGIRLADQIRVQPLAGNDHDASPEALIAWTRRIEDLKKGPFVSAINLVYINRSHVDVRVRARRKLDVSSPRS